MKGKLAFLAGAALGYVLGARAGRKRYEQIKAGAEKLWHSPPVQKGVDQIQEFVDDHAPDVQAAVAGGAKKVVDQVARRSGQKAADRRGTKSGNSRSGSAGGSRAAGELPGAR